MKKLGITSGLLIATIALASCSYLFPARYNTPANLPSRQQLCAHLRQQLIFQQNIPNAPYSMNGPNIMTSTPINKARISNEYEHYNCDQIQPVINN